MTKLLALDTSFTYEMICQRKLQHSVTCRDLDGYFEQVWSVHPFASMLNSDAWSPRFGHPVCHRVDRRNTFVEGKVGRFAWLRRVPLLNFAFAQLGIMLFLVRLIRREKIAVIRVGDPHYLGLMGWMLARATGAKLAIRVCSNYDTVRADTGKPIYPRLQNIALEKRIERFLFKRFDLVAGVNQDNLDYGLANGARPERSTVFRYGNLLDQDHFILPETRRTDGRTFPELGLGNRRVLLAVARLEPVKRPEDFLRVVAAAHQAGHDVIGILVGEGSMRAELGALAEQLGIADRLVMPGNQTQKWLAAIYPRADVFVCGQAGRALSEAGFAAAPVVAYDLDWHRELIEDGVNGHLVPPGDWQALGRQTASLLDDPARARRLGAALRESSLHLLDAERLNAHERDTYTALLSKGRRAALVSTVSTIH